MSNEKENKNRTIPQVTCLFKEKPRKSRRTARNEEVHEGADIGGAPVRAVDLEIDGEYQFCFLRPCVTARELYFVGSGQDSCDDNGRIRKGIYKRDWKVINNAGGWNDPRYLAIKVQRANGGEWAFQHNHEVMPMCVLTQATNSCIRPKGKTIYGSYVALNKCKTQLQMKYK